ncbi:pentatricopeptide repeat-containing protein At3g12770-like [Macadamia integrifolia]|uniref:pentatricopeptide repeat-containing protein At3g12770-like n=1 Tax=Macadamia integrifolia TaxID=60698 RepID=UPI001C4F91AD|nr:pentatricopeptide repeat-containing protein At3g12770-like [Macadamia integrifolia]
MPVLQLGFLSPLSNSFPANFSTQNLNHFPPEFNSRATTARNVSHKDTTERYLLNPQAHITGFRANLKNSNGSIESNDEINQCLNLLNRCNLDRTGIYDSKQIHARVLKLGLFGANRLIVNKLAIPYANNSSLLSEARRLFDEIPERTVPAYAALIGSYCQSQQWEDVVLVFGLMIQDGVRPDKYLVPTLLKAFSALQSLEMGRMIHGYAIRKKLELDVFVGNALIDMYAKCRDLRSAKCVFDSMQEKDVVSWTALVSAFMDEGLLVEARDTFDSMQFNGVKPDLISWNSLVSGFAQNGEIDGALQLLEEMKEKGFKPGVSSWNGVISGCKENGYHEDALDVFHEMLWSFEELNAITIASVLPACAGLKDLDLGQGIHAYALKCGLSGNIFVGGSLIDMYSKSDRTDYAERVFMGIKTKNPAVWNGMIAAYVNEGKMQAASELLHLMQIEGSKPDMITYNTILAGYARKGQRYEAFKFLLEMGQKGLKPNIVSFNLLVSGFQQSGLSGEALKTFRIMQTDSKTIKTVMDGSCGHFPTELLSVSTKPNTVTITSAIAACADLNYWFHGKEIHGYILRNKLESNIFVSSALVDMYAKCHDMGLARKVFLQTEDRNIVSWNALLSGHNNNGEPRESLKLFLEILEDGLVPSMITLVILLSACTDVAALRLGRELHGYSLKSKFDESTITLASALINMYAKCGSIVEARLVFDTEVEKDVALWNAMISGYSVHGMAKDAIELFEQLVKSGIQPDHITFTALLSSCTREGLVEEGWKYFNSIEGSYGIKPSLEHYTCMVGIMGSAGLLEEALDFIGRMPYSPDACVWGSLLRACRVHLNPEIGGRAAKFLFELEPGNASNYILIYNIFAMAGLWDSARDVRSAMSAHGLMSMKECSSIDAGNTIDAFKAGDSSHPKLREILEMWDKLASEMEHVGYFPLDPIFEDEEINIFSCMHTEKLAICFGIISLASHRPISISKNVRMCIDCHTSAKHISKIIGREIFVRDGCFYHHFKDGMCNCQDRW